VLNRIRFKKRFKQDFPFKYNRETGLGLSPTGYSIWTDKVAYHFSSLGFAEWGERYMGREAFIAMYEQNEGKPLNDGTQGAKGAQA